MTFAGWQRIRFIAYKEMLHILRDPQTLFFTLFIPILEMFMLGYAINTNVRDISTVVVDFCNTQESRRLIEQFENSGDFEVVRYCSSENEAQAFIVAGRAQVGIVIPEDFSRKIEGGQSSAFAVLVDGTVSSIAAEALNVGNAIAQRASLARDAARPIAARRVATARLVQSRYEVGVVLLARINGGDVPDVGHRAVCQRDCARKGIGDSRTVLHDSGATQ